MNKIRKCWCSPVAADLSGVTDEVSEKTNRSKGTARAETFRQYYSQCFVLLPALTCDLAVPGAGLAAVEVTAAVALGAAVHLPGVPALNMQQVTFNINKYLCTVSPRANQLGAQN